MKKIVFFLIAFLPVFLMAQPGMPNNPTPVDGFIGLLAAAGVAIGISRKKDKDV